MNVEQMGACRLGTLVTLIATLAWPGQAPAAEPSREQMLTTMKSAATFMSDEVALNGGHVWVVSEDLGQRWGEVPARPSQIWLQGGTERVGQNLSDQGCVLPPRPRHKYL